VNTIKKRCAWVTQDEIYINYHDNEWGRPIYDDHKLFEFLILEGMQAGLSWLTILKKRNEFQQAFHQFKPEIIADFKEKDVEKLLQNKGIIRNRLKIQAAINNAQAYLHLKTHKKITFSDYLWAFVDNKPIMNNWRQMSEVPTSTDISMDLSKDLKKNGFKFVGHTICYAFMQAVGMVFDHTTDCFCYKNKESIIHNH
tara:strand:- start:5 stop:598 length:594 start_codon:yes stop_codon:yes gene_type:complete